MVAIDEGAEEGVTHNTLECPVTNFCLYKIKKKLCQILQNFPSLKISLFIKWNISIH